MTAYRNLPLETRFWQKVDKDGPIIYGLDNCWIWSGCKLVSGYGVIQLNKKKIYAHRCSYEMNFGPIPIGIHVCHKCDNPLCVRPSHLFLGNFSENMRDKVSKGRQSKGSGRPLAKLTDSIIRDIRERYINGNGGLLAKEFGVTQSTISKIVTKETWKHV